MACCDISCKEWVVFLFTAFLNFADLITDALFFSTLMTLKKGLVYGRVSDDIQRAVLAFGLIGIVLFSVEVINAWRKLRSLSFYTEHQDLLSALAVWFSDVPQIILNVIVAGCREERVNGVQLAKGGVILVIDVLRFVIVIRGNCEKKVDKTSKAFVVLGVILTFIGSVLIFVFSFYGDNLKPHNSSKYFENVGIFARQDLIFQGVEDGLPEQGWLNITDIQTIRLTEKDLVFRYTVVENGESVILTKEHNVFSDFLQVQACYVLYPNESFREKNTLPVSACTNTSTANPTNVVVFQFHFIKPDHGIFLTPLIFGDISFHVKRRFSGGKILEGSREVTNSSKKLMRYFGYPGNSGNSSKPVYPQRVLADINTIWRTGQFKCIPSGHDSPTEDNELNIANCYLRN